MTTGFTNDTWVPGGPIEEPDDWHNCIVEPDSTEDEAGGQAAEDPVGEYITGIGSGLPGTAALAKALGTHQQTPPRQVPRFTMPPRAESDPAPGRTPTDPAGAADEEPGLREAIDRKKFGIRVAIQAQKEVADEDQEQKPGWEPEDITDILDGNRPPVLAEIGRREDGMSILYPGKEHSIAGEPESGKTWFALMVVAQELKRGHRVTYIDFEDDAGTVVGRLMALGVLKERLRALANQFRYVRPETAPTKEDVVNMLTFPDGTAHLAVYDGITEAATLMGLDVAGGDGQKAVAELRQRIIRPALSLGCAALSTDHVVKLKEARGRYAIGAQHKLAGLTGAMFMVDVVDTWGRGKRGRSRINVTKDRNAHLRQNSLAGDEPNVSYFGDLVGNAENEDGLIDVKLYAPSKREEVEDAPGQPAAKYRKFVDPILAVLEAAEEPMSTNAIVGSISGNKTDITTTLEWLISSKRVERKPHGRGYGHTLPTGSGPGPTESETQ